MQMEDKKSRYESGFSVVVVTKRKHALRNILDNYQRQTFEPKELIVMIHHDEISEEELLIYCHEEKAIRFEKVSAQVKLGSCLNKGYEKASYKYIAKMDDDDYYGDYYLQEAYDLFQEKACHIVCKHSIFYYLKAYGEMVLHPRLLNYTRRVKGGAGATLCMTKETFDKLHYSDLACSEDVDLLMRCREDTEILVYSTTSYNFLCIRELDCQSHTWSVSSQYLKERADKAFGSCQVSLAQACQYVNRYPVNFIE